MNDLIYDALMLGRNKSVSREEYLVYKKDKSPVSFKVQENEITFQNVMNDTSGIVHIELCSEGFAEIEVYTQDAFIELPGKVFTTDEFRSGVYEFTFTVRAGKLHAGRNYAMISFRTPVCTSCTKVVVYNQIVPVASDSTRKTIGLLCRDYLDLRLGNLFQTEWQNRALKILDNISGSDRNDLFLSLYKANVLISCERYEEAKSLIDFVSGQITRLPRTEWDLICYFMYISSLYEMDDEGTRLQAENIRAFFDKHPSWRIIWVLFYMDWDLSNSPKRMLELMETEFLLRDMNSPVMYYEAAEIYRRDPELITELSDFVIHTLNFAAKEDFLNVEVSLKAAELVWDMDEYILSNLKTDTIIRILKAAYDRFESNIVLKSLCKTLICAKKRDPEYHRYYGRAIKAFLASREISNYFIYSNDPDELIEIPEDLYRFFVGRDVTLGDYRAYFLACVVRDRERYSEYYGKYIGSITRFAAENIEAGNISKPLALIYTHLMDEDLLFPNLYQRMLELISTVQIDTDNKLITSVLVFHREFNEYQENFLESGRANIRVHSDDAVVLFKDVTGNLYADIAHTAVPLIDKERYIDKCIENADITRYMLVGRAFERLKELKEPHAILEYMLSNLGNGQLRGSYEQSVLKDLIVRYSRSSSDSQISDRLLKFLKFDLDEQTRGRLIEVMIDRKMFKEASLEIEKSGHSGVDGTHIAALSHILAEVTDYEKDMVMDSLCLRAFEEMPYDPVIFKYMYLNYDGSIEALERIYDTAVEHEMSEIPVACRILRCSMDQDVYDKKTGEVFAAYFEKGDDTELKTDYMIRIADRYLYDRSAESEYIFPYIEESLVKDQEFPDRTVIAFLIEGRKRQLKGRILKVLEERLRDLVRRGIMLEEFKFYRKYFQIPAALANTYIAETFPGTSEKGSDEHITSSNMFHSAPVISFELNRRGKIIKGEEAMKEVAAGCYCYYFTLFYGESVIYSISKGSQTVVTYNDLQIVHDGSRYSDIDNMIRLLQHGDERCLKEALGDYYIKNELIERLF